MVTRGDRDAQQLFSPCCLVDSFHKNRHHSYSQKGLFGFPIILLIWKTALIRQSQTKVLKNLFLAFTTSNLYWKNITHHGHGCVMARNKTSVRNKKWSLFRSNSFDIEAKDL